MLQYRYLHNFKVIGQLDLKIPCTPFLKIFIREKRVQSFQTACFTWAKTLQHERKQICYALRIFENRFFEGPFTFYSQDFEPLYKTKRIDFFNISSHPAALSEHTPSFNFRAISLQNAEHTCLNSCVTDPRRVKAFGATLALQLQRKRMQICFPYMGNSNGSVHFCRQLDVSAVL